MLILLKGMDSEYSVREREHADKAVRAPGVSQLILLPIA